MAKKSNRSILAIVGGLIVVLGVVLSIFIEELGWWNFKTFLFGEVASSNYLSVFFADGDPYFADTFTLLLPGIIASIGGIMCITGNRILSFIGSVLVIVGVVLFLVFLGDSDVSTILSSYLDSNIFFETVGGGDPFSGAKWYLGIGFFMTAGGGILSLIGAITASKK